jgi:hypothetical protein
VDGKYDVLSGAVLISGRVNVDVELVGVEHFDLGLSLLQLRHRNVRRRVDPGALVKIDPAGAEA